MIQADNALTNYQKNQKLKQLESERQYGILVRQAAQYRNLETVFAEAYKKGLVTLKEYQEIVNKLNELESKIANDPRNTKFSIRDAFRQQKAGQSLSQTASNIAGSYGSSLEGKSILGEKVSQEQAAEYAKAFSAVVSESYNLAQEAMQSYFNREAAAIKASLDLQIQRMDIEREQVKARAQSTAEMESIERQYASKKRMAEQAAFEKTKELKKKEAKISLATELGGIWASVWSIGNPIAAAILGAVMSGLAVVRYGMRVSDINSQKFEYGGDVPTRGGKFKGKPHNDGGTPFSFRGQSFEAEVDELAIIRTKNANKNKKYNISGSHAEIASMLNELGGGVSFRPGAKLKKFEYGGTLGMELQAPIMPPPVINHISTNNTFEKFDEVIATIDKKTDAINNRIDRLEVVQKTSTVTDAQRKEAKQKSIGTL